MLVEETFVSERGRKRRRRVPVDLGVVRARLRAAGEADRAAWEQVRAVLLEAVEESRFELWLEPLALIAVDVEDALVVSAPPEMVGWVTRRFGRILDGAAERAGRPVRVAGELERQAAEALGPVGRAAPAGVSARKSAERPCDFPADGSFGGSADTPAVGSVYPSSYTELDNQLKEVS